MVLGHFWSFPQLPTLKTIHICPKTFFAWMTNFFWKYPTLLTWQLFYFPLHNYPTKHLKCFLVNLTTYIFLHTYRLYLILFFFQKKNILSMISQRVSTEKKNKKTFIFSRQLFAFKQKYTYIKLSKFFLMFAL